MKTQCILRSCFLLAAVVMISHSFAQNSMENQLAIALSKGKAGNNTAATIRTKKINNINLKIQRSFLSYYKTATNESWSTIGNDYLVCFTTGDTRTRALFSKTGSLLYTIRYGTEKDLPGNIDQQVRSTYYDFQITSAILVTMGDSNVWIVSLKNKTNYVVLRIKNGETETMQQYHEIN